MKQSQSDFRSGSWFVRLDCDAAFRAMLGFFAIILLAYGGIAVANSIIPGKSIKDYELWYDTGQRILHGEHIYPTRNTKFSFMYPPTAALLLAPVSLLGKTGLVVSLTLVNAAAWSASIVLAVRLAAGSWGRQHPLLYLIPSVVVAVYVWSCFHLGQPSVLLLALMLGAFVALQEDREILAGSLLALSVAIKAFPVVVIVYLLYRRYWIAAASLLLGLAFLLVVLPTPFRGFPQARHDLQRWTDGMVLKYDDKGVAQRPGRGNSWRNQSIFGVANRMLRHIDADAQYSAHTPSYANFADLSFAGVNRLIAGAGLVLGVGYVAVMPRRGKRTSETDAMEFALLILLMLLFTPLAFGYLFACLLFPFTVLVWKVLADRSSGLWIFGAFAVFLLALSIPLQKTAQTYGNTFFATLILFLGLAVELWRTKQRMKNPAAESVAVRS